MAFNSFPITTVDSALTGVQSVAAIQKSHDALPAYLLSSTQDLSKSIAPTIVNDLEIRAGFANFGVSNSLFIPIQAVTSSGFITSFSARVTNAQSGRTLRFLVLDDLGSQQFDVLHATSVLAAETAGVLTFDMPTAIECVTGNRIGVIITTPSTSNSISFISTGGPTYADYGGSFINTPDITQTMSGDVQPQTRGFEVKATVVQDLIVKSDKVNVANGVVGLDANKQIPEGITSATNKFFGKTIGWVGTSIPAQNSPNDYPTLIANKLQTTVDNQSVGSSGVVWNSTRALSLSATIAELTASFPGNESQSYENKIIGKNFDYLVIDHGYNDRDLGMGAVTSFTELNTANFNRATFAGAMEYIIVKAIQDQPSIKIVLLSPPNRYFDAGSSTTPSVIDNVRAIYSDLVLKYNCPFYDASITMGVSEINKLTFNPDGIHPDVAESARRAVILAQFLKTVS